MRLIDADALKTAVDGEWCPDMMVSEIWDVIDHAPTIGGWISVKDRLPMLIETVLFIGKNYYGNWFGVKRGYFDGSLWHSDDFGTIYSTTPVTHWMPLPEPPEEVSGDG